MAAINKLQVKQQRKEKSDFHLIVAFFLQNMLFNLFIALFSPAFFYGG